MSMAHGRAQTLRRQRRHADAWLRALLVLRTAALGASGCATLFPPEPRPLHGERPPGRWHRVEPGETLGGIAAGAGIPIQDLIELNGIEDPDRIAVGQYLFILRPEPAQAPRGEPLQGPMSRRAPLLEEPSAPRARAGVRALTDAPLAWPITDPVVSSPFGTRWGKPHEGVDLLAPIGTPVLAADAGEVVYAGDEVKGYGNMVVLRHADGLLTVYAHNSIVLVARGDQVARGQIIARVGQSGRASAPHLHFEVRKNEEPVDPLLFLPRLGK